MRTEIQKVTEAMQYVVYHLSEYEEESLKRLSQGYLDRAWDLFDRGEATEYEALHIRDLGRIVCMILDSKKEIVF